MAKQYRVLAKSFIGGKLHEEGDVIDGAIIKGKPGGNLEEMGGSKPAARKPAAKSKDEEEGELA